MFSDLPLERFSYHASRAKKIFIAEKDMILSFFRYHNVVFAFAFLLKHIVVKGYNYTVILLLRLDAIVCAHPPTRCRQYRKWLKEHYPRKGSASTRNGITSSTPLISIVTPLYNTPRLFLVDAVESVLSQSYGNWELILIDDGSNEPHVKLVVEELISRDARISFIASTTRRGISAAQNLGLSRAKGEFVAVLDHDDTLAPHAIEAVIKAIGQHPTADVLYSDEDKLRPDGFLEQPYFKPDWCPDTLLSTMYVGHLLVLRKVLVEEVGGFRSEFDGSQDWDLALRVTECARYVHHIPDVLYHWRISESSNAIGPKWRLTGDFSAMRAISDALRRREEPGHVSWAHTLRGHFTVRYEIKNPGKVSIIIPFKDIGEILDECLESIFRVSNYSNFEVIVIDNGSVSSSAAACVAKWKELEPDRFMSIRADYPFNHSRLNNEGVIKSTGEYLLFLNSDIAVITADWMQAMIEQAQRKSIGAVGAMLLFPDNKVQHGGVLLGVHGVASHAHKNLFGSEPSYFGLLKDVSNYSAVTGACLMCAREKFFEVGMFDESLGFEFNDIDLCLRFYEAGYRTVFLPHVKLYHYETLNVGKKVTTESKNRILKASDQIRMRWNKWIDNDPCYSPHLTRYSELYSYRVMDAELKHRRIR